MTEKTPDNRKETQSNNSDRMETQMSDTLSGTISKELPDRNAKRKNSPQEELNKKQRNKTPENQPAGSIDPDNQPSKAKKQFVPQDLQSQKPANQKKLTSL